jgi:hypothetical protein
MKTAIPQFLILVLSIWFGSLQSTHGVNPPPDGGYPLGNTAEGEDALFKTSRPTAPLTQPSALMRSLTPQPATTTVPSVFLR